MSNNFVHNGILRSGLTRRSMVWRQVLQISLQIYYGQKSDRMEGGAVTAAGQHRLRGFCKGF